MKKLITSLLLFLTCTIYSQNGLHFDDTDDMIQTNYPGILGNNAISVEAWIKPNAGSGESIITAWGTDVTNGGRFTFRVNQTGSTDVIRIEIKGAGLNGTTNLSDGFWHHVAVTYDPTLTTNKYKLFVDGSIDAQGNLSQSLNIIQDVNLRIGRRIHPTFTGWFGGSIDEIRVWSVARSATEIQNNMNSEFCNAQTGLEAYYKLNQGIASGTNPTITTAIDETSLYNGTMTGFGLTGVSSNWTVGSGISTSQGYSITNTFTECTGFSVNVGSNVYSTTGLFTDIFTGANGCDSTIVTDLTIVNQIVNNQTVDLCFGNSITVGPNTYLVSGQYTDTLYGGSSNGCDSVVNTNLTVLTPIYDTLYITECFGGSYTLNGATYTSTGQYLELFAGGSSTGCDSTVVLNLIVLPENNNNLVFDECNGFNLTINGTLYDTTGNYTVVLPNASINGCDSIITLDLTIHPFINQTLNVSGLTISANHIGTGYQWIDCTTGNEINGETNQNFTATANGEYAVVISEGPCTDTSVCATIANVGIAEWNDLSFQVYPNPTEDVITIRLNLAETSNISILNMLGKEVKTIEMIEKSITIDFSDLASGTYILSMNQSGKLTRKVIVKK